MGKKNPPAPPSPKETGAAQTGTNIGTAIANNTMQLIDQDTPYGSLTYSKSGSETYTDPYTGETYEIPKYSATTSLNDQQQQTLDASQAAETNLAQTAQDQSAFLRDYLGEPAQIDTTEAENRLEELGRARIDPRFERDRAALESQLTNQGLQPGSAAWETRMGELSQAQSDAYNQLYLSGRGQAVQEAYAERNQPINEIIGLLSGSQVQNPAVSVSQPGGAATTDIAGLINKNYDQRLNNWQIRNNQSQGILGGLFGLGSSAITGGLFG